VNVPLSNPTSSIVPIVEHDVHNNEQHLDEDITHEETNSPVRNGQNESQEPANLRRSQREKRSTIPDDYMVYLQESDLDVGIKNDPISFLQAIECNESDKWIDAIKDELKSMEQNKV